MERWKTYGEIHSGDEVTGVGDFVDGVAQTVGVYPRGPAMPRYGWAVTDVDHDGCVWVQS